MYNDEVQYYVLDQFQVRPATMEEYAEQMHNGEHIVEHTIIEKGVEVWTCLTGHDQRDPPCPQAPPLLFETMVVGVRDYDYPDIELTSSLGQAKSCHYLHVARIHSIIKKRRLQGY